MFIIRRIDAVFSKLSPTPQIASPQSIQEKGVFMGVSNNVVILSFISTILKYSISLSLSLTPLVSS